MTDKKNRAKWACHQLHYTQKTVRNVFLFSEMSSLVRYYEMRNIDFIIGTNSLISTGDNVRNILFRICS
jgi:hypothetical protein